MNAIHPTSTRATEPFDRHRYEVPGLLVRERVYPSGFHLETHEHSANVVSVAMRGEWTDTCDGKRIERRPGPLQMIPAGAYHGATFSDSGSAVFLIEMLPEFWHSSAETMAWFTEARSIRPNTTVARLARASIKILRDPAASESLECRIVEIVSVLRERVAGRVVTAPRWLVRVREHLTDSFRDPPAIKDLARTERVRPGSLTRAFLRQYGCTPSEYVAGLRLDWARRQVQFTDQSLAHIAHAAGFSDQPHFSRAFVRRYGRPPGQFRRAGADK